ncbi:hypothetical protein D3C71_1760220 [compost metagenome]
MVFVIERDAFNPGSASSHGTHIFFREGNGHTVRGPENQLLLTVCKLHINQLVFFTKIDRDQAAFADIIVILKRRLLHDALAGGEE